MVMALHILAEASKIARVSPDPAKLDDGSLARRIAAAGAAIDSAAETELYRRFAPRVRLYGLRHMRDRHAAQDLVQQVLLMTLEQLRAGKVREPDLIASFILGMSRMVVREVQRGSRRRDALLERYGSAIEPLALPEPVAYDADRLAQCLQTIGERERTVLVQTFFADQSSEELARQLGLSAGNVRIVRHRALRRLRECLGAQA